MNESNKNVLVLYLAYDYVRKKNTNKIMQDLFFSTENYLITVVILFIGRLFENILV